RRRLVAGRGPRPRHVPRLPDERAVRGGVRGGEGDRGPLRPAAREPPAAERPRRRGGAARRQRGADLADASDTLTVSTVTRRGELFMPAKPKLSLDEKVALAMEIIRRARPAREICAAFVRGGTEWLRMQRPEHKIEERLNKLERLLLRSLGPYPDSASDMK